VRQGRHAKTFGSAPRRRCFAPLGLLPSCPLSLALKSDISIDVSSGMIYHHPETRTLAEGLSSTSRPDVEVHYVSESGTPSPPPI
jgi:hypothetical protein